MDSLTRLDKLTATNTLIEEVRAAHKAAISLMKKASAQGDIVNPTYLLDFVATNGRLSAAGYVDLLLKLQPARFVAELSKYIRTNPNTSDRVHEAAEYAFYQEVLNIWED